MTKQPATKTCSICSQKRKLTDNQGEGICSSCIQLSQKIHNNPELLRKVADLAGVELMSEKHTLQVDPDLPDVLDGVRYRTTDRERNTWYVSVSEIDGNPVEIFASTAFENDQHLQSRISNLTTITRLISLILRHVFIGEQLTLEKTLNQLNRSSRQPNDLPEMLERILSKYTMGDRNAEEKEEIYIP